MSESVVIKLGGTTIAEQAQVLAEVAALARRRPVILVHGGGKRLTEWLDRMGVVSEWHGGLRVTDAASLEIAAAVLRGVVNSELVAGLRALGVDAVGLSGVDGGLLVAERVENLGFMAHVDGVRDASGAKLDSLTAAEAEAFIEAGVIGGGMVPKVRAALGALGWEGTEVIIAAGSAERALERALDDPTFGTRLTASRSARVGA